MIGSAAKSIAPLQNALAEKAAKKKIAWWAAR